MKTSKSTKCIQRMISIILSCTFLFVFSINQTYAALSDGIPDPGNPNNINILEYFHVPDLSPATNSVYPDNTATNVLHLTDNMPNQFGVAWSKNTIDLNRDFEMNARFYINNPTSGQEVADGIGFVLQNDPDGTNAFGQKGWGLGAYGFEHPTNPFLSKKGMKNALVYELDTYYNGISSEYNIDVYGNGSEGNRNPGYKGHVAILETNSDIPKQASLNINYGEMHHRNVQYGTDENPIYSNKWRSFSVAWNAETRTFTYTLEGFNTVEYKVPDLNATFGGTTVRFGFTGSTGTSTSHQLIAFDILPIEPVTVKYIDEATGADIIPAIQLHGEEDETWQSERKDFSNIRYIFSRVEGAETGVFLPGQPQTVIYYYKKFIPGVLKAEKSSDQDIVLPGDIVEFTIAVSNTKGNSLLSSVLVDDLLPAGLTLNENSIKIDGVLATSTGGNNHVMVIIPQIAGNQTVKVTFESTVTQTFEGEITNIAAITDPGDPSNVKHPHTTITVVVPDTEGTLSIVKQIEGEYTPADDSFLVNIKSSDYATTAMLSNSSEAKWSTIIGYGTYTLTEIVPMEYTYIKAIIEIYDENNNLIQSKTVTTEEKNISITIDSENPNIKVTIINTFKHKGYFHNTHQVNNHFKQ